MDDDVVRDGHVVADLFTPEPAQWGLRGDPYVWRSLREQTAALRLPADLDGVSQVLHERFTATVSVDLHAAGLPEHVYREEFAHGGMSSGKVHLTTWNSRFFPLLLARAKALHDYSWWSPDE